MNIFNILVGLFILFSAPSAWSEDKVLEELNCAELSPILALPKEASVRPEFKSIQSKLKDVSAFPYTCPNEILNQLKKLSNNRGLLDSVHFYFGICKDLAGESKLAIDEYEKSLNLKRSNKDALLRLAYLYSVNKDYARSLSLSEEVVWLGYKPKDIPLYLSAVAQKELGNLKEAQATLDQLDTINPKFAPSLVLRKNLILQEIKKSTDPNKVKILRDSYNRLLPRLLALDPENRTYSIEYAKILLSQGHPIHSPNILNQGLALTRKFSRQANKIDEAFLLLELQFLEKQGKSSEALNILNTLSESAPLGPNLEFRKQEIFNKLNPQTDTD